MKMIKIIGIHLIGLLMLALLASVVSADVPVVHGDVHAFGTIDPRIPSPNANGVLIRRSDGVTFHVHTNNLDGGAAYTAWAVVFNNPAACTGPCGLDDFSNTEVNASVFWADGRVIANTSGGVANFSAHIPEGIPSGDVDVRFGNGLLDAEKAEVHLLFRTHGQPIDGQLNAQLTTFAGGCDVNECHNQQGIAFIP